MQGQSSFHYQHCQVWPSYTNICLFPFDMFSSWRHNFPFLSQNASCSSTQNINTSRTHGNFIKKWCFLKSGVYGHFFQTLYTEAYSMCMHAKVSLLITLNSCVANTRYTGWPCIVPFDLKCLRFLNTYLKTNYCKALPWCVVLWLTKALKILHIKCLRSYKALTALFAMCHWFS